MNEKLKEFEMKLQSVDWFYMMIDDHKRYMKEKTIYEDAKQMYSELLSQNVEGVQELWDSYDPYSK